MLPLEYLLNLSFFGKLPCYVDTAIVHERFRLSLVVSSLKVFINLFQNFFGTSAINIPVQSFSKLTVTFLVIFHERFQYQLLECFMEVSGNLSKAFMTCYGIALVVGIFLVGSPKITGSFRRHCKVTLLQEVSLEPSIKLFALFFSNLLFMLTAIFHERFHSCLVQSSLKVFINLFQKVLRIFAINVPVQSVRKLTVTYLVKFHERFQYS